MSKLSLALIRLLTLGMLMVIAGPAAAQQTYPSKPIRLIVPFPPGGSNDVLARLFSPKLTESLGEQVVVDNRGGGSTVIGTEALLKSPPDGHTIMFMNMAHVTTPLLITTPYDPFRDFAPIATIAKSELILTLHPSLPANTLQEFITLAKSKPGQLNYASSGNGDPNHLATEMLSLTTGIKMQHIPYKGGGPALADLLGGQVQVFMNVSINFIPHIKSGKVKALAITGESRLASLPQLPTFTEAGLPGFDAKVWYGVLAPGGTPKAIVDKLSAELSRILAVPEFKENLANRGMDPFFSSSDQFTALMKADTVKLARTIKAANIKLEN